MWLCKRWQPCEVVQFAREGEALFERWNGGLVVASQARWHSQTEEDKEAFVHRARAERLDEMGSFLGDSHGLTEASDRGQAKRQPGL